MARRTKPGRSRSLLAAMVAGVLAAGGAAATAGPAPGAEAVDAAVRRGADWLAGRIDETGRVRDEADPNHVTYGGRTALAACALLAAGRDPADPPLSRAVAWLTEADLRGVYAVAMRARALAGVDGQAAERRLARDVEWLIAAAGPNGGYGYTPPAADGNWRSDNSNTQMALLGVAAGAERGADVPQAYWRRMEAHWIRQQQGDGGWGYITRRGGLRTKTYGSMTAAGVASLLICMDHVRRPEYDTCAASESHRPIRRGLNWLAEHYTVGENPRLGASRYLYYLYTLSRVGIAGGRADLGGPWYSDGARRLLAAQAEDGSWGPVLPLRNTAFAVLFLARSRAPQVVAKLRYAGPWNCRPRDAAHWTRWMARQFERELRWGVLEPDAPAERWEAAPVIYLSGSGAFQLGDRQVRRLRAFILRGGTLLSEAACGSVTFTRDVRRLWKQLFPDRVPRRLPPEHPAYAVQFDIARRGGLMGLSNGVRELAIHAAEDLSLGLQRGPSGSGRRSFELVTNAAIYATGRRLGPVALGQAPLPTDDAPPAKKTLRIARVRHAGGWNPEPLAWPALAAMARRYGLAATFETPVDFDQLDAGRWPVAWVTGVSAFALDKAGQEAVRNYVAAGGTLVFDAAGGGAEFTDAVVEQVLPLFPNGLAGRLPPDSPIYRGPAEIDRIAYRTGAAAGVGEDAATGRLRGLEIDGRVAIVYSAEDITAGLVGYLRTGLRGYAPSTAKKLAVNLLAWAASPQRPESQPEEEPRTRPRTQPATRPASGERDGPDLVGP